MKIALIFVFMALGIAVQLYTGIGDAWYLYAAALILLVSQLLFGSVWAAFRQMKRGNIDKAHRLLKQTIHPGWLYKTHRAYYHFIKGMIALQKKALPEGKTHLLEATRLQLRTQNDQAMATLNLAHTYFVEKEYREAQSLLQQIKTLQPTDLMIREKLSELEQALSRLGH